MAARTTSVARAITSIAKSRTTLARAQAFSSPSRRTFSVTASAWTKKYTTDHEWVELSADNKIGTIGISEYAAKALGDVVYVELPTVDEDVEQGNTIGAVESVKSASDILTPVSGKILEVNEVLSDKAGTINRSPESEGWIAKIEVNDSAEIEALMDADAYKQFTEEADDKH